MDAAVHDNYERVVEQMVRLSSRVAALAIYHTHICRHRKKAQHDPRLSLNSWKICTVGNRIQSKSARCGLQQA